MRIYFDAVLEPERLAVSTEVIRWHLAHGWVYNVWECSDDGASGRIVAVFYITVVCGVGGVLHFDTVVLDIPPAVIRAAMRKGVSMVAAVLPLVLATIPVAKSRLIRHVERLGFVRVVPGDFVAEGRQFVLLKYLKAETITLKAEKERN